MPINVRKGGVRTQTYAVKGDSLADIWDYIKRRGPRDPNDGKRYSGLCRCEAALHPNSVKWEFATEQAGRKFESQIWMVKGKISYNCKITMPKLGRNSLSKDAKREWNRFVAAVGTHEQGHVKSYGKELKRIASEIEALKVSGTGRDENAAKRAAYQNYAGELSKIDMTARLNADAAKYDRKTKHGEKQGAKLKTDIE